MQFIPIALAVVQGVSALSKAGAEKDRLEAQARIQEYNAAVAAQRAETTRSVYASREENLRRQQRVFLGRQRAQSAESGAGLLGTNADLERQSMINTELDVLGLRYEGELEAKGLLAQANIARQEAGFTRSQKSAATLGGWLGVGAAALSGAGGYLRGGGSMQTPAAANSGNFLRMDSGGTRGFG